MLIILYIKYNIYIDKQQKRKRRLMIDVDDTSVIYMPLFINFYMKTHIIFVTYYIIKPLIQNLYVNNTSALRIVILLFEI